VSVTDSKGNIYTADADVTNGSGTTGVRTLVFSAPVTTALTTSDRVTITFGTSTVAKAVSVNSVSGLVIASPKDQSQTGTGNSSSPSSGSTSTTTRANELLFGAVGVEDSGSSFSAGSGFTTLTSADAGGSGSSDIRIRNEYQIVSATGTYSATGSLSSSVNWSDAIVTYKAANTSTTLARTTGTSPSTYGDALTFTATVSNVDGSGVPTGTVEFFDGATDLGAGSALSGSGSARPPP